MRKILLSVGMLIGSAAMTQVINTFPYNEDFEAETGGTTCGPYTMSGVSGWTNDVADGGNDWSADINGTGSSNTGPTANSGADFNPGTAGGRYMVTETSGCDSDTRNLESPWFDFTGITNGLELSFAYHMYGADMGTMSIDIRTGISSTWTQLAAPFTDDQDLWQISVNDITSMAGEDSVQVRIVAMTGPGFGSDMAIDDFSVIETSFTGSIIDVADIYCFGATGSMTATSSYGIAPIAYAWDNGETTATVTDLVPGNYCVTMTDANSDVVVVCGTIWDYNLATEPLEVFIHSENEWICTDSMGLMVVDSITGGMPGYTSGLNVNTCSSIVDSVQVGTNDILIGGSTYPSPLGNWYWGTRHQMVYLASELTAAGVQQGNISGMALFIDNMGSATAGLTNMNIKVGSTNATTASAFDNSNPVEVYPQNNVTIGAGWNWFDFGTSYYWNGIDNLIIETCFNNSGYTSNPTMAFETTSYISTVYYRADNATVCGNSAITGTSNNRAIIQLKNCDATPPTLPTYNYVWDMGSTVDSTFVPGGSYLLTVNDFGGCVVIDSLTISESAPVNIDDMTICETNPNLFDATPGFDSYLWNTSETTSSITIMTGGQFYVDATDSLGCKSTDTAFVSTLPPPVLIGQGVDELFGGDGFVDLQVYGNAWPFTFDWDNDGTGDTDDTQNLYNVTSGDYTVVVTDSNGCYTTMTVTVDSQLGIDENGASKFNIYPNPTNGLFFIQPKADFGTNVSGHVVDASGRLVEIINFNGNQTVEVDFSSVEAGIYFVNITVDGVTSMTKIIVE